MKNSTLNTWLWRWHVIAGLLLMPIMFLLAVTGSIYLFQDKYEANAYKDIWEVPIGNEKISYQQQLLVAMEASEKAPEKIIVPVVSNQATQFISGRFSGSSYVYVNPYTAEVTGNYARADTLMQKVRKLHGELLLGDYGTKVIELAASWFVVLLMTGLYIWWPTSNFSFKGFFWIRMNKGRRTMMRDIHAVIGFWTSLVLLIILAGGLPWTDVFGENYKRVLQWTDSGKPAHYSNSKGLASNNALGKSAFTIDQMVAKAEQQQLAGVVTITLPKNDKAVFTVSNSSERLRDERVYHFDQYSGALVKALQWQDVGVMAAGRTVVMRLHQGEFFGLANWLIVLITAILLAVASVSAMFSYIIRKPSKSLGIPRAPANFMAGKVVVLMIIGLAILLPLFGLSVMLICAMQFIISFVYRSKTSNKLMNS